MKWEVHSFGDKSKEKPPYVVEAFDEGKKWTCTCPHWVYRLKKQGTRCKHIDFVVDNMRKNEKLQEELMREFEQNGLGWEDEVKPDLFDDEDEAS